jgi:maltose O-acetyltransferase
MAGAWSARLAGVTRRGGSLPLSMWSRIDQESYMRQVSKLLRAQGVTVEGMPLFVAPDLRVDRLGGVTLGDRCVISTGVSILTHDYSLDRYAEMHALIPADEEIVMQAPVRIGAYAFIGMDAMIMPGVTVGDGAIVGARSLVTRDVEPGSVVGGVPAKVITTAAEAYEKAMASGAWKRQKRPF